MGVDQLVTGGDVDDPVVDSLTSDSVKADVTQIADTFEAPGMGAATLQLTSAQSISEDVVTPISWDTSDRDTDGFFDEQNPTRITIPEGVSEVVFGASSRWDANANGVRYVEVVDENGNYFPGTFTVNSLPGAFNRGYGAGSSAAISVSQGDYFKARVYQDGTGGALDLTADERTWFGVMVTGREQ